MKELIHDFIENWALNGINNTDKLLSIVEKFAFSIAEKMGIKQKFKVQWKYNQNLFIFGSFDVETKTIFFNINRIIALVRYKIKSETKEFTEFVEKFVVNFVNIENSNEVEKSLYFTLTNKPKDLLHLLGDYELIPFNIATTVLHELRHLYQIEQAEEGKPFFLFITKNDMRHLQRDFNPMCEPAEIDAIFFQLQVFKDYCVFYNLNDVFIKSYILSVPQFTKKDIEDNMQFISNNSKHYLTSDNLSRLQLELETINNWQIK